jgi:hypothetical protein
MARASVGEVQNYIRQVDYPATRDDILRIAEKSGADEEVREALLSLPHADFDSSDEVCAALGKPLH